jgi:hypothetical protein
MGMVIAMVKAPHGLAFKALTTTNAQTASRITMMLRMAR